MTVIAATAAVSPVSPAPAVGGKDVAEGFDAMLAVATAGEAPVTPATSGQSKAQAAGQAQDTAASDEAAEQALAAEQGLAAGQTDAAAQAAATLVAAMVPPTQQTFVAALQAEAEMAVASVPALAPVSASTPDDAALAAAELAQDASAVAVAPALAPTSPVAVPLTPPRRCRRSLARSLTPRRLRPRSPSLPQALSCRRKPCWPCLSPLRIWVWMRPLSPRRPLYRRQRPRPQCPR